MPDTRFTLVAAVNDRKVLKQNLLASPDIESECAQMLWKEGARSASAAYNEALDEASCDVVIFVHQDIYLPRLWFKQLRKAIEYLDTNRQPWGVLGCFGSSATAFGGVGRVYTNGLGLHGNPIEYPVAVETLDEIVLVIRKSSGLRFDPLLPGFHMYGVDICMAARHAGWPNFAIPAFCVHNTNQLLELPPAFYECYEHVKRRWAQYLPIASSCMVLSKRDEDLRKKKRSEFIARVLQRRRIGKRRVDDPTTLLSRDWGMTAPQPV